MFKKPMATRINSKAMILHKQEQRRLKKNYKQFYVEVALSLGVMMTATILAWLF